MEFIENLNSKAGDLNEKELFAVLKTDEKARISEMIRLIKRSVLKFK